MKTDLKGGCFVLDPGAHKPGELRCIIGRKSGAKYLSQHLLDLSGTPSPVYAFGKSDVILFAAAGSANVTVSGQVFQMAPATGLYVRPGEAFQVSPNGDFRCLVTVCPEGVGVTVLEEMPDNFDGDFPERVVKVDSSKKEAMGVRFFQVLVSKGVGSDQVTQFIGEIPLSKARSHFHLYEEALYVLSGEGLMWTEDQISAVKAGSIIFLPKRQQHSLECTSKSGLRVAGHFTPAGSPAENY
ncbi:MAG: cupin domain-containing protein [Proteobacteria bacterium]|nr:cupin domain-containing protein [Pseudomonadota bacterium]